MAPNLNKRLVASYVNIILSILDFTIRHCTLLFNRSETLMNMLKMWKIKLIKLIMFFLKNKKQFLIMECSIEMLILVLHMTNPSDRF